jgi:hypothetical protein
MVHVGWNEPLGTLVVGLAGHGGCVIGRILSRMEKRQLQASAASELKAHGQISALCVASVARLKCLWLCLVVHCGFGWVHWLQKGPFDGSGGVRCLIWAPFEGYLVV